MTTAAAIARSKIDHPLIDGDSHIVEYTPLLLDYLRAAGGGDIYVPTPAEKAAFKEAAAPVFDWFKANVDGGEEIFNALNAAVAEAEADLSAVREGELN